ncbi:hypothetical protein [Snodgrassella gandavensis]|uniref:hypothetical protein n=1 Tax=Snodgrassella gandavensis TaxID=2946698 RepID=UPI001EF461D3|nr:hypothetical protein [Snodgrassella gandavensis]
MAKKKPSVAIFNTINLLKASVIFLAIFHLFWKLLEPPFWYPPLDKGAMAFIGALLILLCLVACSGSLLWGFGQTIKQVFAPCHTGTLAVDKSTVILQAILLFNQLSTNFCFVLLFRRKCPSLFLYLH